MAPQAVAQTAEPQEHAAPEALQTGDETPWIYEGSDVPQDKEWLWGAMDNGLRYAVRENGVPPGQVSIRIRIDAGSMHEREDELGFAHLLEHLSFRESTYLKQGEAIPTWQRLGASFGSDTNAETSPTHTAYKLDLPNATPAKIEESIKLLSGMMRAPVLSKENLAAEVPIVLAEKRERGGPGYRVAEATRSTLFKGQLLGSRLPIGTEETLLGATPEAMQAFQERWYRPENAVVVIAGDADPMFFAAMIEKYFGDWQGKGPLTPAPAFGDPVAPEGVDPDNPVGEVAVLVEPDLPRTFAYAYLRPWRKVDDTVEYNEGRLADLLATAIIQRRLEARARVGGSFLYASVEQDKISRSTDATFVSFAPLTEDWGAALTDVRAIIADAVTTPPTQEEIDREAAQYDAVFVNLVEQRSVMAGSSLADEVVDAVDIREAVAAPETFLQVFRGMKNKVTPQEILQRTQQLFKGDVIRATYVTPAIGEASDNAVQTALRSEVTANTGARLAAKSISFDELEPVGEPGTIVSQRPLGVLGVERIEFANGTRALLASNDYEPGRVAVRMHFGAGKRAFEQDEAAYIALGEMALVGSGQGVLGQEELDRITTGRVIGFNFEINDATFVFSSQTRGPDLDDQLYLFANKLSDPAWDPNPVIRSKAAQLLAYDGMATSPGGVLQRDLEFLITAMDGRFKTPSVEDLNAATPEGFREVWAPILEQGDVEILIFGDFDQQKTVETLRRTIGAIPTRKPIAPEALARVPAFPESGNETVVRTHRGDANQAAAVIAWPTGGGVAELRQSRQLEILASIFDNRLVEAMRERAGASYSPQVGTHWPIDLSSGGRITAIAQLKPEDVPVFFTEADAIAKDLAANPPTAEELERATEPLKQLIRRAMSGNLFWLYQIEGSSTDPRRLLYLQTLQADYSETTPERMQALAQRYFGAREGWQMAIIPEGQELAKSTGERVVPAVRAAPALTTGR
ncbi:M16 family metallopeptidase [Pontixanthobacter aquaemixtae]|uniref:M16 family metallopeptidase n=1 Tax=Pontixanthobacter aquaemixtae TaxID=1958940 RepID=UPI001F384114|nr:M16 family metallopeptidase [Pontixanthobacter aquaemixtae]